MEDIPVLTRKKVRCLNYSRLHFYHVNLLNRGVLGNCAGGHTTPEADDENSLRTRMEKNGEMAQHELRHHVRAVAGVHLPVHLQRSHPPRLLDSHSGIDS